MLKNSIIAICLIGCVSPSVVEEQKKEIESLKEEVKKLNEKERSTKSTGKVTSKKNKKSMIGQSEDKKQPSPEMAQARTDLNEIKKLKKDGKTEEALAKIEAFVTNHPNFASLAKAVKNEIEAIGKPAPKIELKTFFSGEEIGKEIDTSKDTVFIVFWELWCPHCRNHLPVLETLWKEQQANGLKLLALTNMSRGIDAEKINAELEKVGATYPTAHLTDKSMAQAYNIRGIPAAAMVKDGKIVWRGHPAAMSAEKLKSYYAN